MSQYKITNIEQTNRVFVFGWDQPLGSYFLQIHDMSLPEDDQIVEWLGATPETKMYEVEQLVHVAQEHGLSIPHRTEMDLYEDKDNGR